MKNYKNFINESVDYYDFIYNYSEKEVIIHFDTKKWIVFTPYSIEVTKELKYFNNEKDFKYNGGKDGGLVIFINKLDEDRNYAVASGYFKYDSLTFKIYDSWENNLETYFELDNVIYYFKQNESFIADCISEMAKDWNSDVYLYPDDSEIWEDIYDMYNNDEFQYLIQHDSGYTFINNIDKVEFIKMLGVENFMSKPELLESIKKIISTYMSSKIFMKKFNIDIKFPNTYSELDKYDKLIEMVDIDDLMNVIKNDLGEDRTKELEIDKDIADSDIAGYLINKYGAEWYYVENWWDTLDSDDQEYVENITNRDNLASDITRSYTNEERLKIYDDYFRQ